jgi:hypothetical protein
VLVLLLLLVLLWGGVRRLACTFQAAGAGSAVACCATGWASTCCSSRDRFWCKRSHEGSSDVELMAGCQYAAAYLTCCICVCKTLAPGLHHAVLLGLLCYLNLLYSLLHPMMLLLRILLLLCGRAAKALNSQEAQVVVRHIFLLLVRLNTCAWL